MRDYQEEHRKTYKPSRPEETNTVPKRELRRVVTKGWWGSRSEPMENIYGPLETDLDALATWWKK